MAQPERHEQRLPDESPIDLDSDGELRVPVPVPSSEPTFDALRELQSRPSRRTGHSSALPRRHSRRQRRHQILIRNYLLLVALSTIVITGVLIAIILALNGDVHAQITVFGIGLGIGCAIVYFSRWLNKYKPRR